MILKGRGAAENPSGRFERLAVERDPDAGPDEGPGPRTEYYKESCRSVLRYNESPDAPFEVGLNPYRGCEHGCVYCYARPTHEYLGYSAGLDFETKILVKTEAPELLREELSAKSWKPQVVAMSGVTDPYQPVERKLELTRRCLQVLAEFRNPVGIVTKNRLVVRDADVLAELAKYDAAAVFLSVTTLDPTLHRLMEPRTVRPELRLEAIAALARAGVPVGVLAAPVIPGLTDHELPAVLKAAADAGARFAGYIPLRLPFGVKDFFAAWLERHFPDRKEKVLNQIRELRGGKLNDPRFGARFRGEGKLADHLEDLFEWSCRRAGLGPGPALSAAAFRRTIRGQEELF